MQKIGEKKGAVELSISTIVIVVLAVSMLILGLVLIRGIFKGATSVAEMSDEQLKNQMNELYGDTKKVSVYPDSKKITISLEDGTGQFGIGIRNTESGSSSKLNFEYKVSVAEIQKGCDAAPEEMLDKISLGKTSGETPLKIASGDLMIKRVTFSVGTGDPLCLVRYRVDVTLNGEVYGSEEMDVAFTA